MRDGGRGDRVGSSWWFVIAVAGSSGRKLKGPAVAVEKRIDDIV